MSGYSAAHDEHAHHVSSPISVPWVILASVLAAAGLAMISFWLTTFNWIFFAGPFLVLLSVLMFLNDRAGLDHA